MTETAAGHGHGREREHVGHGGTGSSDGHEAHRPMNPAEWDERYATAEQFWSGNPNGALVAEIAGLTPGRALDVGCGEGADAVWLARTGWDVTALDVSRVALDRAARHATEAGVEVRWVPTGLLEAGLTDGSFDVVSAMYPALRRTPDQAAERALIAAVAPGGVLLVVHHADFDLDADDHTEPGADPDDHSGHAFNPADYISPLDVAVLLGDGWQIDVNERRARAIPTSGGGAHHADDLVLRARRL